MRLTIINKTGRPDADVLPYVEFAAQLSTAKGKVTVVVHNAKGSRIYSGWCDWVNRRITSSIPKTAEEFKPIINRTTLGYFSSRKIPLRKPYSVHDREELLTGIAAHEFGHLKKRGHKFRKSVVELYCETRKAIALEYLRHDSGQRFITSRRAEISQSKEAVRDKLRAKEAVKRSPENKRDRLLAAQKRWATKAKRAATALKKISRQLRRLAATATA